MQIGSVWFSLKNYLIEKLTPYNDPVTGPRRVPFIAQRPLLPILPSTTLTLG